MTWPIVLENDFGIRPAGEPDTCFYCNQKVGQEHLRDCVTIKKKIKVRYCFEIEIDVPHFWESDNVEFHLNESSWCADNAVGELVEYQEKQEEQGWCMCDSFYGEFIEVVDDCPIQLNRIKFTKELE